MNARDFMVMALMFGGVPPECLGHEDLATEDLGEYAGGFELVQQGQQPVPLVLRFRDDSLRGAFLAAVGPQIQARTTQPGRDRWARAALAG